MLAGVRDQFCRRLSRNEIRCKDIRRFPPCQNFCGEELVNKCLKIEYRDDNPKALWPVGLGRRVIGEYLSNCYLEIPS